MQTPFHKAIDILTREEIDEVRRISAWRATWGILHAWLVIAAAMALFAWRPNPVTYLFAVAVIGARQLGLAILMHDGAHKLLHKNHRLNDFVSQWFCAFPIKADTMAYRPYHLEHHKNTQQAEDPDLVLSAPFPITKASFARKMIRDLTGQTGFKLLLANLKRKSHKKKAKMNSDQLNFAIGSSHGYFVTNTIMFAVLWALGHPWFYLTLWMVPLLTFFQLVTRIRNIAEHADVPENDNDFRNTRTTRANFLARMFVAPYCVNYHIEHHLFTFVPWYNLPRVHRILREKGYAEKMELGESYTAVIMKATRRESAASVS